MKPDPYQILEVEPGADLPTIKRAYRAAARKYHPDLNPGDELAEGRFKAVQEAWELLRDPSAAPNPREVDDAFLDAFEDAVSRAESWFTRAVLPSYVAQYHRGRGAELAARLHADLPELMKPGVVTLGPSGFLARRRARKLIRGVVVSVDARHVTTRASLVRGYGSNIEILLFPRAFQLAGLDDPVELDDTVLGVVMANYVGVLGRKRGIERARTLDDDAVRRRHTTFGVWAALALVSALILAGGFFNSR
jgi:hypothetical protein